MPEEWTLDDELCMDGCWRGKKPRSGAAATITFSSAENTAKIGGVKRPIESSRGRTRLFALCLKR